MTEHKTTQDDKWLTAFTSRSELEPGTWCVLDAGELLHRCPQCKRSSEMLNHSVTSSGEVNASIACFPPLLAITFGAFLMAGYTARNVLASASSSLENLPQSHRLR